MPNSPEHAGVQTPARNLHLACMMTSPVCTVGFTETSTPAESGALACPRGQGKLRSWKQELACAYLCTQSRKQHRNRHDIEKSLTTSADLFRLSSINFVSCDSACVVLDAERQCLRGLPKRGKRLREGWRERLFRATITSPLRHEAGPS